MRFFENVVASRAGWSMGMSRNNLNNKSNLSRSQNARSERTDYIAINTVDFNRCSGGALRRPSVASILVEDQVELGKHGIDDDTDPRIRG